VSIAWLLHSVATLHLESLDKSGKNLSGACLIEVGEVLGDNVADELDNLRSEGGPGGGILNIWLQIMLSDSSWGIAGHV
jgi:hypothetical protein